jgi:hypothetical protein
MLGSFDKTKDAFFFINAFQNENYVHENCLSRWKWCFKHDNYIGHCPLS